MSTSSYCEATTSSGAMLPEQCDIRGCTSTSQTNPEMGFFKMDARRKIENMWLTSIQQLCGSETNIGTLNTICEKHYEKRYVYVVEENGTKYKRLYEEAVPTLFPATPDPESELAQPNEINAPNMPIVPNDPSEAPGPSTSAHASQAARKRQRNENEAPVPRKQRKYLKLWHGGQRIVIYVGDEDDDNDKILLLHDSVRNNLPILREKRKNQTYTTVFKMAAVKLYSKFPFIYRLGARSLHLPSMSILSRLYFPKNTQLSVEVFYSLKLKVDNMTHAEKQCVVCMGTLSLTPNIQYDAKTGKLTGLYEVTDIHRLQPANTALVVMVRGLFHNWKQVIAFAFLTNNQDCSHVQNLIQLVILNLFHAGLHVRVVMTDSESDYNMFPQLVKEVDEFMFPTFSLNDQTIYFMYDPLYLMKDIRDCFMKRNFVYKDEEFVGDWSDIAECYQQDHNKGISRHAPKLSFNHVYPSSNNVDEIKLVSEVFTRSVGTAIKEYVKMEILPNTASGTMTWILIFNKLMEILNFSTLHPPENNSSKFTGDEIQLKFLGMAMTIFQTMRLTTEARDEIDEEATQNTKFITAFQMTILSMKSLYHDLLSENCWHQIVGLSRDCLTDFFTKLRNKYNRYPTAEQFISSIKKFPSFSIFGYKAKDIQTLPEYWRFLSKMRKLYRRMPYNMFEERPSLIDLVDQYGDVSKEFIEADMTPVLSSDHQLNHMALYLLHKAFKRHTGCRDMADFVYGNDDVKRNAVGYRYTTAEGGVIDTVAAAFTKFINDLEIKFKDNFNVNSAPPTMSQLIQSIQSVIFQMACECFPLDYIKQLYLRMRLYLLLKYNNELLASGGSMEFKMNHFQT